MMTGNGLGVSKSDFFSHYPASRASLTTFVADCIFRDAPSPSDQTLLD